MNESELDPYIEELAREARRPVLLDAGAKMRLLAAIRAEAIPQRQRPEMGWFVDRRLTISPVGMLAMAAGLVGIGLFVGLQTHRNRDGLSTGQPQAVAAAARQLPVSDTVVERTFVILAPQAAKVSVVGDFNQWNATATPMIRSHDSGLWTVTLPLESGRHVYSFVVDGQWALDPSAPVAPDDGFGHASSVIVINKRSVL